MTTGDGATGISEMLLERWRAVRGAAEADSQFVERHKLRDAARVKVHPEIRGLVERFVAGELSLADFRETFDSRSRNEWDVFGLKGFSAAMFLNQVAKNVTDHAAATAALRAAVRVPADDEEARSQIDGLIAYLRSELDRGAPPNRLKPNYAPSFLSACWHAQRPDRWPTSYASAREAMRQDGLVPAATLGGDGYVAFAKAFTRLAKALDISFWELEHLCTIAGRDQSIGGDEMPSAGAGAQTRVWLVSPGPNANMFDAFFKEGVIGIGWSELGDLSQYEDRESVKSALHKLRGGDVSPIQDSYACYQFVHDMEVGDVVIAKKGRRQVVGHGIVTSEYRHDPARAGFQNLRSVHWKKRGAWTTDSILVTKTLTDIAQYPELVNELNRVMGVESAAGSEVTPSPTVLQYSLEDAKAELFASESLIKQAKELLRARKNIVLQGSPGSGKTFFAKRLAYLLMEEKDADRVRQVQFHQSYSYEDFVQGYRPVESGQFKRVDGVFMRFCSLAKQDPEQEYVLIIDEINRGNLSKILGELMLLIEADKRDPMWATHLTYDPGGEPFYVPPNLHIIGTMNTADRSLAMVDYALRRRFVFIDLPPGYGETPFRDRLSSLVSSSLAETIIGRIGALNSRIAEDPTLGEGFRVGHSYFCGGPGELDAVEWYRRVVRTELAPLLREYWFDNRQRADEEVALLLGA